MASSLRFPRGFGGALSKPSSAPSPEQQRTDTTATTPAEPTSIQLSKQQSLRRTLAQRARQAFHLRQTRSQAQDDRTAVPPVCLPSSNDPNDSTTYDSAHSEPELVPLDSQSVQARRAQFPDRETSSEYSEDANMLSNFSDKSDACLPLRSRFTPKMGAEATKEKKDRQHRKDLRKSMKEVEPPVPHFEHERQVLSNFGRMPIVTTFASPFTQTARNRKGRTGLGPEGAYATDAQLDANMERREYLKKPMSLARQRALARRKNHQIDQLFPKIEPTKKQLKLPNSAYQRRAVFNPNTEGKSEQDLQANPCRKAVEARFKANGEVSEADVNALTNALLELPPDCTLPDDIRKAKRYEHSIRLASNLRNVSNGDARLALKILRTIYNSDVENSVPVQTSASLVQHGVDEEYPPISIERSAVGLAQALGLEAVEDLVGKAPNDLPDDSEPDAVNIFEHARRQALQECEQEQAPPVSQLHAQLEACYQQLPSPSLLVRAHALERSLAATATGTQTLLYLENLRNQFTKGDVKKLMDILKSLPALPQASPQKHHQYLMILTNKLCHASEGDAHKAIEILQTVAPYATLCTDQSSAASLQDNDHLFQSVEWFKQLLCTRPYTTKALTYLERLEHDVRQDPPLDPPLATPAGRSQVVSSPPTTPAQSNRSGGMPESAVPTAQPWKRGDVVALTQALHDLPHAAMDEDQREVVLETLLTHLSELRVSGSDANMARQVLQAIFIPDNIKFHPSPEILNRVAVLKKSLSNHISARHRATLHYVENAGNIQYKEQAKKQQNQGYRHVLNICAELANKSGVLSPDATGHIDDFLRQARQAPRIDEPIGQDNDHPLQLLNKALLYAQAKREGKVTPEVRKKHLPAYLAYCNGFLESGKGSLLEEFLNMMNGEFRKYYDRTELGPRTARAVLKSLKTGAATAAFGHQKNPLTELTSGGVRSGVLTTGQKETAKFRTKLTETLNFLDQAIDKRKAALRAHRPDPDNPKALAAHQRELQTCVVRQAMLALMREKKSKAYRIDAYEVMQQVGKIEPTMQISRAVLHHEIGKSMIHPRAKTMQFKMLEQWSLDLFKPTDPHLVRAPVRYLEKRRDQLQGSVNHATTAGVPLSEEDQNNLDYITAMLHIGQTRYIAAGTALEKKDQFNAVQPADFKQFVPEPVYQAFGKTKPLPREGLTKELFKEIFVKMSTENNDVTWATSGTTRGVNLGNFNGTVGGHGAILDAVVDWLTAVRPVFKLNYANKVVVKTGDAAPGGEFVLGHRKASEGALGLRLNVSPIPEGLFNGRFYVNASVGAQMTAKHTWRERSMVLHTPLDVKGGADTPDHLKTYQQRTGDIANFLIQLAEKRNADGEVPTNAQALEFLGDWYGDDQQISFGMRDTHNSGVGIEGHIGANARAGAKGVRVGPSVGVDIGATYEQGREKNGGRLKNEVRSAQNRFLFRPRLDLVSLKTPAFAHTSATDLSTTAVPLVGWMWEFSPYGNFTNTRIVRDENGVRHGMSFVTRHFPDATSLVKYLTAKLEADQTWAKHLTIVPYNVVSENGEPIITVNKEVQSPQEGALVIRKFVKEALAYQPMGNCRFEERVALKPEIAVLVNRYEDELKDLIATPLHPKLSPPEITRKVKHQIQSLQERHNNLLENQNNWTVRWEAVIESETLGKSAGSMFGVVLTTDSQVQATRKHKSVRGEDSYDIPEVPYTRSQPSQAQPDTPALPAARQQPRPSPAFLPDPIRSESSAPEAPAWLRDPAATLPQGNVWPTEDESVR